MWGALLRDGSDIVVSTPEQFRRVIEDDDAKCAKLAGLFAVAKGGQRRPSRRAHVVESCRWSAWARFALPTLHFTIAKYVFWIMIFI